MSIRIYLNKELLLHFKNFLFEHFHASVVEYIEKNHIDPSQHIIDLLEKTNQEIYGYGAVTADIADYLKTKQEMLEFAFLIKKSLTAKQLLQESFSHDVEKDILNACQRLESYAEKLN